MHQRQARGPAAPMTLFGCLAVVALLATLFVASRATEPLTVTGIGGMKGIVRTPHRDGDEYEYSEFVTVGFSSTIAPDSFKAGLTVTPATAWSQYPVDYGKGVELIMRKVPGVTYRFTVQGVRGIDGSAQGAPFHFSIRTAPSPAIPAPLRPTPGEPYRYGALAHPFAFSLTGPTADRQIDLMVAAGTRFVRLDYCGDTIEPARGTFDFRVQDRIAEKLAARGITELPIIEQYCAPKWATGGKGYPEIWSEAPDYAAFAAAVAQHVAERFPKIARIELFNEPNLAGWWRSGNPASASINGDAAARYMRAAYQAVKAATPELIVVGPALADGGRDVDPRRFLTTMYDSGCRTGACWDVLSAHNYRWINPTFALGHAQNQWSIYKDLQAIAVAHGDPVPHVMLTEWGYSTADLPEGLDPAVQAQYIAIGLNLMLADPTVDGIVYVNIYNPHEHFWGRTAVTTADFKPQPGLDVLRRFSDATAH